HGRQQKQNQKQQQHHQHQHHHPHHHHHQNHHQNHHLHHPPKRRKIIPFEETTANSSLWYSHVSPRYQKTGPGVKAPPLQRDISLGAAAEGSNDGHDDATLDCSMHHPPPPSPSPPSPPPPPPPPAPEAVCAAPHDTSIVGDDQLDRRPERPDAVISALKILQHPVFLHQIRLSLAGPTPTHRPMLPDKSLFVSRALGSQGITTAVAAVDSTPPPPLPPPPPPTQPSCVTDSVSLADDLIQPSAADSAYISSPSSAPSLPTTWSDQWSQDRPIDQDMRLIMGGGDSYPPRPACSWSYSPAVTEPSLDDGRTTSRSDEPDSPTTSRHGFRTRFGPSQPEPVQPEQVPVSMPVQVKEVKNLTTPRETKRAETVNTRWKRACLRCRIQKLKCVSQDDTDPSSECAPCNLVSKTSKKTIHHISCHRGKLLDVVLYRQGGLKLTERWSGTTMKEVGDRCSPNDISTVHITLGICDEPLKVDVVSFYSRPGDVTARFWYVREGAFGDEVRRKKEIEAYCLASIWKTADYFEAYIIANAVPAMMRMNAIPGTHKGLGVAEQDVIRRTYAAAIDYYNKLDDDYEDQSGNKKSNPEKRLLHNLFVLWFAIRHTTGSAFICGDNKLGMRPELKDDTYPLFGKVSVPRMIVAQFDSINHTKLLTKYGKWVLQDLEAFFFRNQQRWWWTIYLTVFILLHEASFVSADRYRHARNNHGTKFRYSIPGFVEELQDGCNNILMHWHYYNCKPWPDSSEPWNRHTHFMSDLSSVQYDLVMETLADTHVQKQLAVWSKYKLENGALEKIETPSRSSHESPYLGSQTLFDWDHPFYWVSQMFEERWNPHPTYQREYVL
ncbi:hypothetical protein CP533_0854, partial [Ophiocordyceps camponoti-saundersi (nom. inval.)]